MNYPNNIAMIRRMRGLTQAYVAEQIGVSRPKYIDVEKGLKELTVSQAEKLKRVLDVSFKDLLGIDTDKFDYQKYINEHSKNNTKEIIPPKLFENQPIRSAWDKEREMWYFSVVDIVMTLTNQLDYNIARKYWNKLKQRLTEEGFQLVTNCHQLKLTSPKDGKKYATDVVTTEQAFRIIQSIPSKKAEPFKQWLAKVGAERIDQMVDPEMSIHQALEDYRRLGYSNNWINQRLKSIEIRKDLTDTWNNHGIKTGQEYASLTDIIYQTWAGKTTKEYKEYKGLHKENLRDNMTNEEIVMTMLAELSTTNITKVRNPKNLKENADCAKAGGDVAKVAREKLEKETGKKIVSKLSAKNLKGKYLN
ncbi:helix-turn-helix domain-containing protein [Candidatus Saccharibacteria bacterium]|nr:helix-turn-helix domain-containing protein [Candidatus Saccharibacteria bacterium]